MTWPAVFASMGTSFIKNMKSSQTWVSQSITCLLNLTSHILLHYRSHLSMAINTSHKDESKVMHAERLESLKITSLDHEEKSFLGVNWSRRRCPRVSTRVGKSTLKSFFQNVWEIKKMKEKYQKTCHFLNFHFEFLNFLFCNVDSF